MPIGPNGEVRPTNPNACAIMVAKISTGKIKEQYVGGIGGDVRGVVGGKPEVEEQIAARNFKEAETE